MTKIEKIILALVFGISLAFASGQVEYQRLSEVGIGCDGDRSSPCYSDVLHAGVPFAFLVDNYKISGIGILDMGQDTFVTWAFVANSLFYMILLYPLVAYIFNRFTWPRVRSRHS